MLLRILRKTFVSPRHPVNLKKGKLILLGLVVVDCVVDLVVVVGVVVVVAAVVVVVVVVVVGVVVGWVDVVFVVVDADVVVVASSLYKM